MIFYDYEKDKTFGICDVCLKEIEGYRLNIRKITENKRACDLGLTCLTNCEDCNGLSLSNVVDTMESSNNLNILRTKYHDIKESNYYVMVCPVLFYLEKDDI